MTMHVCKMTTRSPEKREKDALRYLALCANNPIAFRHAIDTVPESSIRRICDAVLNATKGDVRRKLTPAQRRLCDKYKRSIDFPHITEEVAEDETTLATKREQASWRLSFRTVDATGCARYAW